MKGGVRKLEVQLREGGLSQTSWPVLEPEMQTGPRVLDFPGPKPLRLITRLSRHQREWRLLSPCAWEILITQ